MMELLAPAGSFEALRAAVQNGADAVYFGGASFNARRRAKNFSTEEELARAIAYCHRFGVRVYCTFNILVSDREMREADEAARTLARCGADALIVQDIGLARRLRRVVPELPLHASTQMSVHNVQGACAAAEMGFTRVVAARELSRADLEILCRESPVEIEVFAHGALCAAYSGQCYMSAMIGRRSGNRGLCAQPCRMLYSDGGKPYPAMSLKELCMAGHLEELGKIGVASLKIEGRMRRPEYVALATAVYRRALDSGHPPARESLARLATLFSREGFTDGYFSGRAESRTAPPGRAMFGVRTEAPEGELGRLCADVRRSYAEDTREERPCTPPAPVTGVYETEKCPQNRKSRPKLTVSVQSLDQITDGLRDAAPAWIYLPLETAAGNPERLRALVREGVPAAVTLPRVILPTQEEDVRRLLSVAADCGVQAALVGNLGHAALAGEAGMQLRGDFGLNAYNTQSLTVLRERGFSSATASFELRFAAIRDLGKALPVEAIVYGRLPLMLFENCLIRSREGVCRCGKPEGRIRPRMLRDRTGEEFVLLPAYGCRTALYNGVPLWLADRREDWDRLGLWAGRLDFTTESPAECARIAQCYLHGGEPPARFTRGLYYRGVE